MKQHDIPALDRLHQFDRHQTPVAPSNPPVRPGANGDLDRAPRVPTIRRRAAALGCCCSRSVWRRRSCSQHGCSQPATTWSAWPSIRASSRRHRSRMRSRRHSPARRRRSGTCLSTESSGIGADGVATLVVARPGGAGAVPRVPSERGATGVASVFGSGGPALFVPDSSADPEAITNVLLLGGDAGPGRWGLRTDTMIVVCIHEATGRTALISIPRNLQRLQFPPGTPARRRVPRRFRRSRQCSVPASLERPDLMAYYGCRVVNAKPWRCRRRSATRSTSRSTTTRWSTCRASPTSSTPSVASRSTSATPCPSRRASLASTRCRRRSDLVSRDGRSDGDRLRPFAIGRLRLSTDGPPTSVAGRARFAGVCR